MRAEGLSPHGWGNGPGDTYGWHEHGYQKGAVLRARPDRVPHRRRRHRAWPGRQDGPPAAPAHAATVGAEGVRCIEASRQRD